MIAYVTSIGEPTTELCIWSLERNGFEVKLLERGDSLAKKLEKIYEDATDDFIRVDADVVPNKNLTEANVRASGHEYNWWIQFNTFDWARQDLCWGGVQYIKKEALSYLRKNIPIMQDKERPESAMSRIKEFYHPRRFDSWPIVMGIHNYKNDLKRVEEVKNRRNQGHTYDFELARKLEQL